jgi:soluble cytochrome b562
MLKSLLIPLALAVAALAARIAPTPSPAPASAQEEGAEHAESPLETAMLTIEESLGALRRALRDEATHPDALAALATMEEATLRAKLLVPPMAAGVADPERAAFLRDYRRMLVDLLTAELACEAALLDGDADAAKQAFQRCRDLEDAGHERFTEG